MLPNAVGAGKRTCKRKNPMTLFIKKHWNKIYPNNPITPLGWYEAEPSPSLQLIEHCEIAKDHIILDVGSGASTLIPCLLELGYRNLYAVDISDVALEKARSILGERAAKVHWVVDDITNPSTLTQLQDIAIWHDRAVFHFLTEEHQRQSYLSLLQKVVMPGGYVIIATFSLDAADKCSGLPVQRYNVESLCNYFGVGFELLESMDYTYQMPWGDLRPFIYVRFQKIEDKITRVI
jgi:SAM-dependent methyltransferase